MIEPKEYKVIKILMDLVEYKINSITNYLKNYEYPEAHRELKKARAYMGFIHIIIEN